MSSPTPYVLFGIVTDTDGATVINGATVRARNETNNEIISAVTNSVGEYLFDATNFASGYLDTDKITIYVIYTNLEASSTLDVANNEHEANLSLSTIADSSLLQGYASVQDVYDELDITSTDVAAQIVIKVIQRAESRIDERTETKFVATTVTNEVYDYNQFNSVRSPEQMEFVGYLGRRDYRYINFRDKFRLKKFPIISITTLQRNAASWAETDNWTTLTEQEGSGGDFLIDLPTGWIDFIKSVPRYGKRAIRVTYVYGTSTVPKRVERLCVLLAVKDIIRSSSSNSVYNSPEDINMAELSITNRAGAVSTYLINMQKEIDLAWEEVGVFNAGMA